MTSAQVHRRGVAAVVVRESKWLVIRRAPHVLAPGALCFPGGGIEAGESEAEALVREMREELAVEVAPLACLWRSVTAWGVEIAWWEAALTHDAVPVPNPAEVHSAHWLTAEEMLACADLLESNRQFLQAWAGGSFALRQ